MTKRKRNSKKNNYEKVLKDLSKNYWAISTIVLAILLIATLLSGEISGTSMSKDDIGQKVVDFANNQGMSAELISVNDDGELYEVILSIQGQEAPVYVTKDGKNLIPPTGLIPLEATANQNNPPEKSPPSTPTPSNVPKSDKPIVELFVMSHCPFGTQMEKGILPVAEVLKDKIDFKIKFVYYAMHPTKGEVEEQLNQYCIQEEQNSKFLDYLTCFLEAGDGAGCLTKTGIDNTKLKSCTTKTDAEFDVLKNLNDQSSWMNGRFPKFNINKADNDKYNVGGSPTLIINGVKAEAGRDSISLLNAICGAFNTAPAECNTQFEAGQPTPGFGYGTASASNNAAAGCGV